MKTPLKSLLSLLAVIVLCFTCSASANLVTNDGFETGDFTGWTQSGNTGFDSVNSNNVHSGTSSAEFGAVDSLSFISQDLATVANTLYSLSFWLQNEGGTPSEWLVRFNGVTLADIIDAPAFGYTEFTFTGLLATGSTTTLEFGFRNDPNYFHLDDISVASLPEVGSTVAMLSIAFIGIEWLRRKLAA